MHCGGMGRQWQRNMLRLATSVILSSQIAFSFVTQCPCSQPPRQDRCAANRINLARTSPRARRLAAKASGEDIFKMISVREQAETSLLRNVNSPSVGRSPLWARQFRSCQSALKLDSETGEMMIRDCDKAFNLESGSTFWLGAQENPRCSLEKLAKEIFLYYTQGVEFDPSKSGVEWWVQLRLGGDGQAEPGVMGEDITLHWDKDEEMVNTFATHMTPFVGTVTYLTDYGAPTVVLNKEAPKQTRDVDCCYGSISHGFLSFPTVGEFYDRLTSWNPHLGVGKSIAFDGRLLHGALTGFM
eukprot:763125-Hanusia_phi.AAC.3